MVGRWTFPIKIVPFREHSYSSFRGCIILFHKALNHHQPKLSSRSVSSTEVVSPLGGDGGEGEEGPKGMMTR